MEQWHITWSEEGRPTLFVSEADKRMAVRVLARVAGQTAVLFCAVDDHLHVVTGGSREQAGRLGSAIGQALNYRLSHHLAPARFWEVNGRFHLKTLIRYVLDQTSHHKLQGVEHPALWTGSNFQDLIGARCLPGLDVALLQQHLPRLRSEEVFFAVGLQEFGPASDDALSECGLGALVKAGAAALAAPPDLPGRRLICVQARAAVAQLAHRIGYQSLQLADALQVTRRSAQRMRQFPVPPQLVKAIRMQVALRLACKGANFTSLKAGSGPQLER
ncbi:MAG: hypothetical protein HN348_14890 [Proteobacteria bacterium]|nr:hypothetical protein [Pseudomonadota bacterium]